MAWSAAGLEGFAALIQDVDFYYSVNDVAKGINITTAFFSVPPTQTNQIYNSLTPVSIVHIPVTDCLRQRRFAIVNCSLLFPLITTPLC